MKQYYVINSKTMQTMVITEQELEKAEWTYRLSDVSNEDIVIIWAQRIIKFEDGSHALLEEQIIGYCYGIADHWNTKEYAETALTNFVTSKNIDIKQTFYDEVTE